MTAPMLDISYTGTIPPNYTLGNLAKVLGVSQPIALKLYQITKGFSDFTIVEHPHDLTEVHGIGPVTAKRFDAFLRLHYDILHTQIKRQSQATLTVAHTANALSSILPYRKQESIFMMTYSQEGEPIHLREIHRGSISQCPISSSTIARYALMDRARSVILFHNHVSHSCTPSRADRYVHSSLKLMLKMLEITLVDSIIMSFDTRKFFSMIKNKELSYGLAKPTRPKHRKTVQP